jgi:dissimilatory sulfite reductase (desulfoviridin) alpha/beta subunit
MKEYTKEQLLKHREVIDKLKKEEVITENEHKRITYRINQKLNWFCVYPTMTNIKVVSKKFGEKLLEIRKRKKYFIKNEQEKFKLEKLNRDEN